MNDRATGIEGLRAVKLQRPEPASSEVARALLEYILSGQIGLGDKLPSERQLSELFGVGRSVVREGIKSLDLLGLVEFRQGSGTYYLGNDSPLLPRVIEWGLMLGERHTVDLVEARRHIETVTSQLAAGRRDEDELAEMERAMDAMRNAADVDDFVAADVRFHLAVAKASGNSVLSNTLGNISTLLRVWIHRVVEAEYTKVLESGGIASWPTSWSSYQEHLPVFEAIKAADGTAARDAMHVHMDRASERLIASLDEDADTRARGSEPSRA